MTSRSATPVSTPPLSTDGLLRVHASAQDPKLAALEQAITERIGLKTQNEQLWKLVEKQRTGYNQIIQELERMRSERDAHKTKLTAVVAPADRRPGAAGGAQHAGREAMPPADADGDPESPSTPRP